MSPINPIFGLSESNTGVRYRGMKVQYRDTELRYRDTKVQYRNTGLQYCGMKASYRDTELQYRDPEIEDRAMEKHKSSRLVVIFVPASAIRTRKQGSLKKTRRTHCADSLTLVKSRLRVCSKTTS